LREAGKKKADPTGIGLNKKVEGLRAIKTKESSQSRTTAIRKGEPSQQALKNREKLRKKRRVV